MNSNLRRTASVVVVLVLASMLVQPFGRNAAAQSNREGTLQGTWRVQVTPINCQTGAPLPIPSFSALDSYARGGTLTEVVNTAAFQPGQVTPGLGVWSHTQANAYKAVWEVFILFDSPTGPPFFKRGVQRLMRDIEVDGDKMTFNGTSQFFDANGNVVANTCANGTGTRFEDAQDQD